ncbi:MAG: hypothetical protein V3V22_06690 [Methylococcales bacterium]
MGCVFPLGDRKSAQHEYAGHTKKQIVVWLKVQLYTQLPRLKLLAIQDSPDGGMVKTKTELLSQFWLLIS